MIKIMANLEMPFAAHLRCCNCSADDDDGNDNSRRGLEVARCVEAGRSRVRGRVIAGL